MVQLMQTSTSDLQEAASEHFFYMGFRLGTMLIILCKSLIHNAAQLKEIARQAKEG